MPVRDQAERTLLGTLEEELGCGYVVGESKPGLGNTLSKIQTGLCIPVNPVHKETEAGESQVQGQQPELCTETPLAALGNHPIGCRAKK